MKSVKLEELVNCLLIFLNQRVLHFPQQAICCLQDTLKIQRVLVADS